MKQLTFLVILLMCFNVSLAQDSKKETKDGWTKSGKVTFLFSQFGFSNWVTGGENNVAGNLGIDYDFNYVKKNMTWDTKILGSYGLTKSKNGEFAKKTDDRFEVNSVLGERANNNWYYSAFSNFKTQFTRGYIYKKDGNGKEIRIEHTNLFSPAELSSGIGMQWKKSNNLKVNIAPVTAKLIMVYKRYTLPNKAYFGVEEGKSSKFELGFNAAGFAKFKLMENVTMENILVLFADYIQSPQNIDIDYTLNMNMKVNDHLTTNFTLQTVYDNNSFKGFQIRELFGVGFNYKF